ncbi:MAG: penicillin-binding protein 2 [Rhodobacteraceae bacterium]|nr:penicillin-binding protein 2 [Paracoccaceae bacterium]
MEIRRPLRPLARILKARSKGVDPQKIEAEERAARLRKQRSREKRRAELRLGLMSAFFSLAFIAVGVKMGMIALEEPVEPAARAYATAIISQRANIVDRNGAILATNLRTASLYATPQNMADPLGAIDGLVRIFPDLDPDLLLRQFTGKRKFVWVKRKLSPEQHQAVLDLGEPGLLVGPRELRLYPNGAFAAHILGGTRFGVEGVRSAELVGTAGVEFQFDEYLRDPANDGRPLQLSLDLTVQSAMRQVLEGGMRLMNAKAAMGVLMEADTGRIISMVSLPDFDPNYRPDPPVSGDPADSPLFNRAAQGTYELGSTFKIFTAALAMETGIATPETLIDTQGPLVWGRFKIRDFRNYGPQLSLVDVIVKSSNIGSARLAMEIGAEEQKEFLGRIGMLETSGLELPAVRRAKPMWPSRWTEISAMTIAYGHGIAVTPVHLAAGIAAMVNGGLRVRPTLLDDYTPPTEADRVISESTSLALRDMMRQVVVRGTASLGEVEGYQVGGKTGTADKPAREGGYMEGKVISTFAAAFPMSNPEYVLIVSLDEPEETSGLESRRTAGWTAVPVTSEIIRRIAPLLGLRPIPENETPATALVLTSN